MIVNGPDTGEQTQFEHKFGGTIAVFYGVDGWAYDKKGKLYPLPDEMTDGELQKIMEKCLADNHDYLFDMIKDNEIKIDYSNGVLY